MGIDFTTEWYHALTTINSDKAEQHLQNLHLGMWKILFTLIFEQCNIFVHGKDSMTMKYERKQLET